MTDIVDRLRNYRQWSAAHQCYNAVPLTLNAADEIERLRALLVYARVELTGIPTSAETIAKIDAALDRDQQTGEPSK